MDRITQSLIDELLLNLNIKSEGSSKDFEKLANYTVVSNEYNRTFDLDKITVGDGGDTGLDGIAIIINNQLIESVDEFNDLLEQNQSLLVEYLFIQSKSSATFDGGDIGTFLSGVSDFFELVPKFVRNKDISKFAEISNDIYRKATLFRENPTIKLFYVTTGKWMDDQNLNGVINMGKNNLEKTNLFETVQFHPLGARELATAYRKTKESINTTINFNNRITIPKIAGVSQAYIGLLPFKEFKKIISDSDDNLLNVFEDNVRDFQGDNNDVNGGIAATLDNADSEIFSVLNNGVTIVASSISPTGDQFTIIDYQIVNGCQTSNVLYNYRNNTNIDKVNIPIKLIATTDDDVKTRITLATNNQTPIKKEQLAALTRFQRSLELYYNSYTGEQKIYYERRSKQYNTDSTVLKYKVITVPYQIKSFAAMFLNEPHNVTSYFGSIVRRLNEGKVQIFTNDHLYSSYYTSAYAYYKLEFFFKKGSIDSSFRKVKFHILMLFRVINEKNEMPQLNSKKMDSYCSELLKVLNDEEKALQSFLKCTKIINDSEFDRSDKQDLKLVSKTKVLLEFAANV